MSLASLRRSWAAYLPGSTPLVAKGFVWIGLLLLALSAGFALHTWWTFRSFARIDATVSENIATQDAQGALIYSTHLRFQIPGGRIVSFVDPVQSSENGDPSFVTSEVVPAIYPVGYPEGARIATVWRLYFVANVLGILGVIFADLGLILRLVFRRATQHTALRAKALRS